MNTLRITQIFGKIFYIAILVLFHFSIPAKAHTSAYVFEPNSSSIVQTGGIASVHWTYSIKGFFHLTVDHESQTGSFAYVSANATDDSTPERVLDPNEVFNMTSLVGTVIDSNTLNFTGKATDESDILITVNLQDDLAHLVGQTTPPPGSADFFIFSIDAVARRKYSGGTGELNNPYQIATAEDLITLGETPEDYCYYYGNPSHFILTDDIDLDPTLPGRKVFDKAVIAPNYESGYGGPEAPFNGIPFDAVFDGNDHTISNLTIFGYSYLGLFGGLRYPAEIVDLGLVNVNIIGGESIGSLVGSNGPPEGGTIARCYSTGYVHGRRYVGGLVGQNNGYGIYGIVSQCYSTAYVRNWGDFTGGLVGMNSGTIELCYSTGSVRGYSFVGGLVGQNLVVGWSPRRVGVVSQCYSTAYVRNWGDCIGGLVGDNTGSIERSFWDIETSGVTNGIGCGTDLNEVIGKTTSEMYDPNTFMAQDWDFIDLPDGPHDIWAEPANGGYPILWWQLSPLPELPQFSGGSGMPDDPYLISTSEQLNSIGHNLRLMECHFKLTNDINLAAVHFYPIGNGQFPYEGIFDGNYHEISNMTIEGYSYLGLIGALFKGSIRNVGVVDVNIVGTGKGIGGLVGAMTLGTINQCYTTGSIKGNAYDVGGLVGRKSGDHSFLVVDINQCYSTMSVNGFSYVGGLIGLNLGNGLISECYSTGPISGNLLPIGGLVGMSYDDLAIDSFWDMQTSGTTYSAWGTGKTTTEMKDVATYTDLDTVGLDSPWDFVGNPYDDEANEDIWLMHESDYPRLWWEQIPEN